MHKQIWIKNTEIACEMHRVFVSYSILYNVEAVALIYLVYHLALLKQRTTQFTAVHAAIFYMYIPAEHL
jgi:cell division protein FtsB